MESKRLPQVWQLAFFFGSSISRETQAKSSSFSHVTRRDYFATLTASNSISISHWIGHPERNLSSNHWFSGAMLISGMVGDWEEMLQLRQQHHYGTIVTLTLINLNFDLYQHLFWNWWPKWLGSLPNFCRNMHSLNMYVYITHQNTVLNSFTMSSYVQYHFNNKGSFIDKMSVLIIRFGVDYLH